MDDRDSKQDDFWALYNPIERECIQDIESEEDLLERLREQKETALEKLWLTFQSAASSLAQLHKGKIYIFHSCRNFTILSSLFGRL